MKDMRDRNRCVFGSRVNTAILSETQVAEIRNRYTGKHGEQTALAREYGIDSSVISRLVNGKIWRH